MSCPPRQLGSLSVDNRSSPEAVHTCALLDLKLTRPCCISVLLLIPQVHGRFVLSHGSHRTRTRCFRTLTLASVPTAVDKEISEAKLSLNARARIVAESFLSTVSHHTHAFATTANLSRSHRCPLLSLLDVPRVVRSPYCTMFEVQLEVNLCLLITRLRPSQSAVWFRSSLGEVEEGKQSVDRLVGQQVGNR